MKEISRRETLGAKTSICVKMKGISKAVFIVLFALVELSVCDESAQVSNLLRLVDAYNNGKAVRIEDVVAGYREYSRLYHMQSDLARQFSEGSELDDKSKEAVEKYETNTKVLQTVGLQDVVNYLFEPLTDLSPDEDVVLNVKLREKIQKQIDRL